MSAKGWNGPELTSAQGGVRMNDQRSLYDQLLSVFALANKNGHYDAADWIMAQGIKPIQEKMKNHG